jgi:beta-galactosidase
LWHIHNEYGDHVTECFCAESAADFRRWLRRRYADDVEQLNFAWGAEFWAQRYSSFDQVEPPRAAPGPVNPGQVLDWRRFCSDALLECFLGEREVLKEVSPEIPVTTNFMSMFKALDYWKWAAHEDLVSDDAYPDPSGASDHVLAAMNYDLMRSLGGGRPWLLMEQAPSAVSWRTVNVPKRPGLHRLWSLQTVAHGADGVMYFQWRASRAGAEKFHSALLPHGGTATRGWRETVRFGAELQRLGEVAGSWSSASVAIVLDWNSWWALELEDHPSARVKLKELILGWYSALHARNVAVDFVPPGAALDGYRLVLAPNLYSVSVATAEWLTSFVAGGGRLVCGFFSGIVDELDHVHQGTEGSGGGYPGPLRDVLGVLVDEFWPVADGDEVPVVVAERATTAGLWSEWLDVTTAEVVGTYAGGPLAGRPAVTRNAFGSGEAWYVSCHLGVDVDLVLGDALAAAAVAPVWAVPAGVEVTRRQDSDASYLFFLNHNDGAVDLTALPSDAVDLLSGDGVSGSLRLPGLGVAVLRVRA